MTSPKYDFIRMERDVAKAYSQFKKEASPLSRHDLFVSIKSLAYAVLLTGGWEKYNVDYEKASYEYALYIFERIVTMTFSPSDSFPWNEYVHKSIKYGVMAVKNDTLWFDFVEKYRTEEFSEELKEIVADEDLPDLDDMIDKGKLGERIHAGLRMFYSQKEINRLYPLASDVIYSKSGRPISDDLPIDLQDFLKVLICVGKRLDEATDVKFSLTDVSVETFRKAFSVSVRSTIFLAASVKPNYFPRDLLLSHDIDSLYRHLYVTGNATLLKRLDRLIGAVVTVSNILIDGKNFEEAFKAAREELDFEFGIGSVRRMVSRIIETLYLFKDGKESDPLLDVIFSAFNVMKNLSNKIPELIDSGASLDSVLKLYKEMSSSLNNLTNQMIEISSSYSNGKLESLFSKKES